MDNDKKYFLERPGSIRKLWILLYAVCALTVVPEFFLHREGHFGFDAFFGFYVVLGFVSCVVLILFAKLVGYALKKKEDYYE